MLGVAIGEMQRHHQFLSSIGNILGDLTSLILLFELVNKIMKEEQNRCGSWSRTCLWGFSIIQVIVVVKCLNWRQPDFFWLFKTFCLSAERLLQFYKSPRYSSHGGGWHFRQLTIGVIRHHLCSKKGLPSRQRWTPSLLSQTICPLCPKCGHWDPQMSLFSWCRCTAESCHTDLDLLCCFMYWWSGCFVSPMYKSELSRSRCSVWSQMVHTCRGVVFFCLNLEPCLQGGRPCFSCGRAFGHILDEFAELVNKSSSQHITIANVCVFKTERHIMERCLLGTGALEGAWW